MIGVFDSGVGGLGVLTEIRRRLPSTDLVYIADHAAAPYGDKPLEEVADRSATVAAWLIDRGCRVVTLACNTASAAALQTLRDTWPEVAFVGMEPAVKPAAEITLSGRVGVVATAATFQGRLFASVVDRFAQDVEVVTAACPSWVDLVELGDVAGPDAEAEIRRCLRPMITAGVDVVVLACTHYPALRATIEKVLGDGVRVVDPSPAVAAQTARLAEHPGVSTGQGRLELYSTGNPDRLETAAKRSGMLVPATLLAL